MPFSSKSLLGGGPALLEHVDAGQDAQRDDLVALLEVVDEELGGVDAPREATDRVDEGGGAVGLHTAVEDHDGLAGLAGTLDRVGHRGGGVGRDDEGVAVALGDEVVDVGDLGVVVVTGVAGLHLGDDALVLHLLEPAGSW